jgi:CHAT domain-containing protein
MEHFYKALRRGRPAAAALRDAQVAMREMTGSDVAAAFERWRGEYLPGEAEAPDLPAIPPEHAGTRLYGDPFFWAPFMLIGRPY